MFKKYILSLLMPVMALVVINPVSASANPMISDITPNSGPGGTYVTLTGSGFSSLNFSYGQNALVMSNGNYSATLPIASAMPMPVSNNAGVAIPALSDSVISTVIPSFINASAPTGSYAIYIEDSTHSMISNQVSFNVTSWQDMVACPQATSGGSVTGSVGGGVGNGTTSVNGNASASNAIMPVVPGCPPFPCAFPQATSGSVSNNIVCVPPRHCYTAQPPMAQNSGASASIAIEPCPLPPTPLPIIGHEPVSYPDGSVIKIDSKPTVYLVNGGVLQPFTSSTTFTANGFKWSAVQNVSSQNLADPEISSTPVLLPDGTAVKGEDATVYYIAGGKKYGIPTPTVFSKLNLSFKNVVTLSNSDLQGYADGGIEQ